jgi:Family of unknown function (DUF6498)
MSPEPPPVRRAPDPGTHDVVADREPWYAVLFSVAANLVPIVGVIFFGWDLFLVLALFWAENVVIGIVGILRVAFSAKDSLRRQLFEPVFFVVHYGGFMFGHAMLLLSVFGDAAKVDGGVHDLPGLIHYLARPGVVLAVLALAVAHGWSLVGELATGELRKRASRDAMTLPYRRVLITQAGLLFGAFFVEKSGQPVMGLVILLAIKTLLDLRLQRRAPRSGTFARD